jgi:hypothetical protein
VAAHKFLPGRAIALEATLDQLGILLQAFLAPFSSNLLRHNSLRELLGLSTNGTKIAPQMFPATGEPRTDQVCTNVTRVWLL